MKKALQIFQVNNLQELESDYFEHDGPEDDWRLHASDSYYISWNTNDKKSYEEVESILDNSFKSLSNGSLSAWCDSSGYDYWGSNFEDNGRDEWNYSQITFHADNPYITNVKEIEEAIQDLFFDILEKIRPLCKTLYTE